MTLLRKAFQKPICLRLIRCFSNEKTKPITGYENADRALQSVTGGKVYKWLDAYEDFVGLTEVKAAQDTVTKAEANYKMVQEERRAAQKLLNSVHLKLKAITSELDKTRRGEDAYLELITKENEVIKEEKKYLEILQVLEEQETSSLGAFSSALRASHEKERVRAERMKYWGIMGSLIGAGIGIVGTTVNNYYRMKELRRLVSSSADLGKSYGDQLVELSKAVDQQHSTVQATLTDIRSEIGRIPESKDKVSPSKTGQVTETSAKLNELLQIVKKQESVFEQELSDVRKVLAAQSFGEHVEANIVYIGPELKSMLEETEKSLAWKMKLQTACTVTLIYTASAIAVTFVLKYFGGGS